MLTQLFNVYKFRKLLNLYIWLKPRLGYEYRKLYVCMHQFNIILGLYLPNLCNKLFSIPTRYI